MGIDVEILGRIFALFFMTKAEGRVTGLVAKAIGR
jgi:hypothetical protein